MSFLFDDMASGGQLCVGVGMPIALGLGDTKVRGSAFIEGPEIVGNAAAFPFPYATLMVSPLGNSDSPTPFIPGALCYGPVSNPFSLAVSGPSGFLGNVETNADVIVGRHLAAQGDVISNCGRHVLSLKKDLPFDMPHPNREGWRLRHVCIEGPEIAVYCRGRVSGDGVINVPSFWEGLVNMNDITISLTPMGSWQELFVKEIVGNQIIVRNNAGGPINADYYIVARRLDDDLIVEYEGETHEDYPGGNEGYSFNFEHNYVEGLIRDMVSEKVTQIEEEN